MNTTQHQRTVLLSRSQYLKKIKSSTGKLGRSQPDMKGGGRGAALAAVVALLVVLAAAAVRLANGAVTCADVNSSLRPCVGYLTGKEAAPPAECCAGVKSLRTLPVGTAERRQACECVKQAAARFQGLNADAVRDLPEKCGSPLPFPISLSFDCTTIP